MFKNSFIRIFICVIIILGATTISLKVFLQYLSDYHYQKALLLQMAEEERVNHLELAIRHDPGNGMYYDKIGLIYLKQGDKFPDEKSNKYQLSNDNFRKAVHLNPANYKYHFHLATMNFKKTKDSGKFLKDLKKMNKLFPTNKKISKYIEKLKNFNTTYVQ